MPHLITGGARSGKSRYAENLALAHPGPVCYLATAELRGGDAEFAARVEHHRQRRPAAWSQVDAGRGLGAELSRHDVAGGLLLVDCLGMWLMRFFNEDGGFDTAGFEQERAALLAALEQARGEVLLVSNEIGWGVVAASAQTRCFVDELGRLNQAVAAACQRVTLVACGLPLVLKGEA